MSSTFLSTIPTLLYTTTQVTMIGSTVLLVTDIYIFSLSDSRRVTLIPIEIYEIIIRQLPEKDLRVLHRAILLVCLSYCIQGNLYKWGV
jgi:hypothetical protein